jgi:molybdopterin-containing oxidoreductase family iron-sulfur binding subunit
VTVGPKVRLDPGTIRKLAARLMGANPSLCLGPGRAVAGADAADVAEAIQVLNAVLGNVGRTLRYVAGPPATAEAPMEFSDFTKRAAAGEVGALVLHHADPLGYGSIHSDFVSTMASISFIAAFTNELDDTAHNAHLVLADHHFLESWSDVPTRPGRVGIQQPVMEPALTTRAAADELLVAARLLGKGSELPPPPFGEALRKKFQPKEIEEGLRLTEIDTVTPRLLPTALSKLPDVGGTPNASLGLSLVVIPSFRQLDGRKARSALLEEIPDPLSGFAWTSWVELHPATASSLGVSTSDVIGIEGPAGRCELPAFVTDTIRSGVAAVPIADAAGILPKSGFMGAGTRVKLSPTGFRIERPHPETVGVAARTPLARSIERSAKPLPVLQPNPSMYPEVTHPVHHWALAVDLDRCNGCGACTAACYVENNLAVVGADEVARGRSMSWIPVKADVDRGRGRPSVTFLPLSCQHCTAAPCESVCPTYATYHTKEGLNAQVYARCVGTRYCENNCPYGVRRFNFYDSSRTPLQALGLNPDVTVRERGVTEKCTLCNQRIRAGEEQAKLENRPVRDGEIVSACAAACPTRAIAFGDLKDPSSEIARLSKDGRAYKLLEELNTQPGVFYLARRRGEST